MKAEYTFKTEYSASKRSCTSIQDGTPDFNALAKAQVFPLFVHDGGVRGGSTVVDACALRVNTQFLQLISGRTERAVEAAEKD